MDHARDEAWAQRTNPITGYTRFEGMREPMLLRQYFCSGQSVASILVLHVLSMASTIASQRDLRKADKLKHEACYAGLRWRKLCCNSDLSVHTSTRVDSERGSICSQGLYRKLHSWSWCCEVFITRYMTMKNLLGCLAVNWQASSEHSLVEEDPITVM